jgi:hypothetical protein
MEEQDEYTVTSTSRASSTVEDLVLSDSENGLTRKVLRSEIVQNTKSPTDTVKATFVHQKRRTAGDDWVDLDGTTLKQTKFNEPSRFAMDSRETKQLFKKLTDLYDIGSEGVKPGRVAIRLEDEASIIQTDAPRARLIRKLLEADHGKEVWEILVDLQPELAEKLSATLLHESRLKAVEEFENEISGERTEHFWKVFFKKNSWMFGGANVALLDESRLDIGNDTDLPFEVDGGYMDIVELKRPDFPFWKKARNGRIFLYRDKYPIPYDELSGAIAQTSGYILQAEKKVANSDFQLSHGVRPLKPRGLIVHGRSSEWSEPEWDAFRLLNDQLHGVQVLTFDHLLAQAKRLVDLNRSNIEATPD